MSEPIKLKDKIKFWLDQDLTPKCARCKAIGRASQMTLECGGLPCITDIQIEERTKIKMELENKPQKLKSGGKVEL